LRIAIKIGGHVFPFRLDLKMISEYAEVFKRLRSDGHRLIVVTGGGEEARKYIGAARKLGGSELVCDLIGIQVSRLNARLLISRLGIDAFPEPPTNVEELRKAFETEKIVVLGGLQPGQSTNAVAALSAESIDADLLINATDVDGVYTVDPQKDANAKKLDEIDADDFLKKILTNELWAGSYELFDPVAVKIVKRSKIPTRIIDGRKVSNIERVVKGEKLGTLILT